MLPQGFFVFEWRTDISRGPCTIGRAGVIVNAAGVCLVGMQGAVSPFDGVTLGLGSTQAGCGGVTGLSK